MPDERIAAPTADCGGAVSVVPPTATIIQHDYCSTNDLVVPPADLVFADPPYNLGLAYADDETKDRLRDDEYKNFTVRTLSTLYQSARPGATLWWMTSEEHADWTGDALTRYVGDRLFRIVWHESFAQYQGNRGLTKDYRFIFCHQVELYGEKHPLTFHPDAIREQSERQRLGDKRANPNGRVPGCIWKFRRLQGTSVDRVSWHPCQLPPELLRRIVLGWSNPGDTVMDAFAGSGSLGKVALAHGRNFVGIDKSPTYVAKMREELKPKGQTHEVA